MNYPGGFNYESFAASWGPALDAGVCELHVIRHLDKVIALLGCAFIPDPFSGLPIACEQFWYILPEHRGAAIAGKLFDAFECEAKTRGCTKIVMACLVNPNAPDLDALYTRRGYAVTEKTFTKVL